MLGSPVTPVTSDGSVTDSISGVTDMTGVTERRPREPNARVKGRNAPFLREEQKGSVPSQSVTPATGQQCDRCRIDATAAPCDRCPLYGAWLERSGLGDDERIREVYACWVELGGWRALWGAGKARNRAVREAQIREVLERFPRVRERWPNYPSAAGER